MVRHMALALIGALGSLVIAGTAAAVEGAAHEAGRDIYNFRCYYCHGYSGDARTLAATFLTPAPRSFVAAEPEELDSERIIETVTHGRPGTAMVSFSRVLSAADIRLVADFVFNEFVVGKKSNTRYHTLENGWPDHERYRAAFPFATGEIALDGPWEDLTAEQIRGKRLFLKSCITCHDRARVEDEGLIWSTSAVSFPRNRYEPGDVLDVTDGRSGASIYAMHEIAPVLVDPTPQALHGERIFQSNCAFCHGADASGANWIGSFLQSRPRDLSNADFLNSRTDRELVEVIGKGLVNTSMPAWESVLSQGDIEAVVAYLRAAFSSGDAAVGG